VKYEGHEVFDLHIKKDVCNLYSSKIMTLMHKNGNLYPTLLMHAKRFVNFAIDICINKDFLLIECQVLCHSNDINRGSFLVKFIISTNSPL
jgi:hypothetical protein